MTVLGENNPVDFVNMNVKKFLKALTTTTCLPRMLEVWSSSPGPATSEVLQADSLPVQHLHTHVAVLHGR